MPERDHRQAIFNLVHDVKWAAMAAANTRLTEIEAAIRADERAKILAEGVRVYGVVSADDQGKFTRWTQARKGKFEHIKETHTALLIQIEAVEG